METRLDFQRIVDDMDKILASKRQELEHLEEQLESTREKLNNSSLEEHNSDLLLGKDKKTNDDNIVGDQDNEKNQEFKNHQQEQIKFYETQIEELNEELNEFESINLDLSKENIELKSENNSIRLAFDDLGNQLKLVSGTCEKLSDENTSLRNKFTASVSEIETLRSLLERSQVEDDNLLQAFEIKLNTMSLQISALSKENDKLKADNELALKLYGIEEDDINDNDIDLSSKVFDSSKRHKLIQFASVLREKDAQIYELKLQLSKSQNSLPKNDNISHNNLDSGSQMDIPLYKNIEEAKVSLVDDDNQLTVREKQLEFELEKKDERLFQFEKKINYYETIVPLTLSLIIDTIRDVIDDNFTKSKVDIRAEDKNVIKIDILNEMFAKIDFKDFVENIKKITNELFTSKMLSNLIEDKDKQIDKLVGELNSLDVKFKLVQHQCELLQSNQKTNLSSLDTIASGTVDDESKYTDTHVSVSPLKSLRKDLEVNKASDIIIDGNAKNNTDTNIDESNNIDPTIPSPGQKISPKPSVRKTLPRLGSSTSDLRKLRELENENKLLELAMKEILLSIKCCDSQCKSILIDCPALERLCQMIEARYLANYARAVGRPSNRLSSSSEPVSSIYAEPNFVFQMVTIKSELDLLRGQNEQLRADMKLQTREYFRVLEETSDSRAQSMLDECSKDIKENNTIENSSASCQTDLSVIPDSENKANPVTDITLKKHDTIKDDNNNVNIIKTSTSDNESQTDVITMASIDEIDSYKSWLRVEKFSITSDIEKSIHETTSNDKVKDIDKIRRCENCGKLAKLSNNLLNCIIRVESKVALSEEICTTRMKGLQQLLQMMNSDLNMRKNLSDKILKERNDIAKQREYLESRLVLVESQLNSHIKSCPTAMTTTGEQHQQYEQTDAERLNSSISYQKHQIEYRDPNNTISLLRAIIVCLQTRLSFKDQRLEQLEKSMLINNNLEDKNQCSRSKFELRDGQYYQHASLSKLILTADYRRSSH